MQENIFNENISGKFASENNLAGNGIVMFITKKLIQLNNGNIVFRLNVNSALSKIHNNLPYQNNIIEISLKK